MPRNLGRTQENVTRLVFDDEVIYFFLPNEDDHIQKLIARTRNFYEQDMLNDIRNRLPAEGIAIDVGAYIGNHTIFLSKICGMDVIAIEPFQHSFEILKKNIELNNVVDRVTAIQKAAGRSVGSGEVVVPRKTNLGEASIEQRSGGPINIIPLDALGIRAPIALIKVDVEGMELDVLKGAAGLIESFCPLVYVEVQTEAEFKEIRSFFSVFSYEPVACFNVTPTFLFVCCRAPEQQFSALMESLRLRRGETQTQSKEIRRLRAETARQSEKLSHRQRSDTLLSELKNELKKTQAEITELRRSTTFQIGRAVVQATVRPFPDFFALPGRLVRIAFDRKKRQQGPQPQLDESQKISVIMTTYNSAYNVSGAIQSILDQTYRNLELIVVDDASTDGTFEKLLDHARADNRVRPFKCFENRGTYWCKNFGITKAGGAYITFQDSDDFSEPNRLDAQIEVLRRDPGAVAATCNYVRRRPNGELVWNRGRLERVAIMVPMFNKDAVLDTVGYFDSVRTSADDEMYHRLRLVFGGHTIQHVDRRLYVASYREGSLTTASSQVDLSVQENADDLSFLSRDRRKYVYAYREWHKSLKKGDEAPYMAFPLLRRHFPAPESLLVQSEPAEEYVTASLASYPVRESSLRRTVASILPQVDKLNVYLNNYDGIQTFLQDPKITVARSQEHGDLRDSGKFFFLHDVVPGYHFTIDDDIVYPPNYVQHQILKILQYRKQAVVGIHGVTFANPIERFYKDRDVTEFWKAAEVDQVVNLLGSGTVAYHTSTVELKFQDFQVPGMVDLWLAVAVKRQQVPMIATARSRSWLTPIAQKDRGLYGEFLDNDGVQTEVARREGPWDFNNMSGNYSVLAEYLVSNFTPEELRSNQIDVEFWRRFTMQKDCGMETSSQLSAWGRDVPQHAKIAERQHFNEADYWLRRHERMHGDPRSVGNLGRSLDENLERQKEPFQRLRSALSVLFPVVEGQSALDLACGVGRIAPTLVEMGFEYTGVDISPVALEQARGVCPFGSFVEGNIVTYQPPQTYDLVIAAYVLVHLVEDADWQAALDTIAASMKPDGLFLLIEDVPIVRQSAAEHVVNRSLREYNAALAARNLYISDTLKQNIVERLSSLRGLEHFYFIKRMNRKIVIIS